MMNDMDFTKEEMVTIYEAVGMLVALRGGMVSQHRMNKDTSMERLFEKMEAYTEVGLIWVKMSKALGLSQEEISEYLEKASK